MKSLILFILAFAFLVPCARAEDSTAADGQDAVLENTAGWNSCKPECTGVVRRGGRTSSPWCAEFTCGKTSSCWSTEAEARNRCGNEI